MFEVHLTSNMSSNNKGPYIQSIRSFENERFPTHRKGTVLVLFVENRLIRFTKTKMIDLASTHTDGFFLLKRSLIRDRLVDFDFDGMMSNFT